MALAAPVPSASERLKDRIDHSILIASLKRMRRIAMEGEPERRAADKRGIKLAKGLFWEDGITSGRLPISSPMATALMDEFMDRLTKNDPGFELEAIVGRNDDAARLLEGALATNWRISKMQELIKTGGRQAGFTRPVSWYSYWDTDARGGAGDLATRLIPGFRSIIDNRHVFTNDMEFRGFREVMSRAQAIELFPDKVPEIRAAMQYAGGANDKPGMPDDPLRTSSKPQAPGQLSRLVATNQNTFTGKTTVKVGGRRGAVDPLTEQIEVEFLWFYDYTPVERQKPKLDSRGKPIYKLRRHEESGHLQFKHNGFRIIDSPRGKRYIPNLEPHRDPVMETVVEKLYPHRRHIAWIPQDEVILWGTRWNGPVPCITQRMSVPIYEYWDIGPGQRMMTLAVARNVLWTILFQRLKLSLAGTWLATTQSGLRRNKLTPEDGQVFYAKKIGQDDIRQFPVTPLDVAYIQVLHEIESEMAKLIGVTPTMQGKSQGRVDTGAAYESLIEQGGTRVISAAQLLERSIEDWAYVAMWYYQQYATHEHFVEVEEDDGETNWRRAAAIAIKGQYGVKVDVVSNMVHSDAAKREMIKEGAALGIYPIPLMAKLGDYPQWRRGLRMRDKIMKDPSKQWMLGIAGAPPGQAGKLPTNQTRSHHAGGGKQPAGK